MSPRPRQASDQDILFAAFRAIAQLGPARMTLADVAKEAGVSPAAIVQRFGSKRALLLATAADAAGGGQYIFPGLRARHRRPVDALLGLAECVTTLMGATPEAIANNIVFFQVDLKDDEFHRHALAASAGMRAGIKALIRDAVVAGELIRCDANRLAAALHATMNGSILNWVVHREGSLAAFVRRDLTTVLAPYRSVPSRKPHAGSVPLRERGQTPKAGPKPHAASPKPGRRS
jgi:AcrR family transcriptional regulator